ncbi:hypothetical protein APHAL10511_001267 [Amanita phalloides]|nr:hypothetical protein APHAL10511_001267 [Amanita phalloides]
MSWYLKYLHPVQTDLAAFPLSLPALAPALRILKSALDAITAATVTLDLQQDLLAVVDLAHRMMSSASSQSSYHWRRLHTDACIIRSVLMLESPTPLNAISSLDSAIIISGATGNDRLDLIQSLIRDIQSRYSSPHLFTDQLDRPLRAVKTSSRLESAALWVPQLDSQPSQLAFQTMYFKRPFVLRGYATEWPAMQEHPWRSASYLRSIAGAGRIVPVEVGFDYRADDWSQKLVSWDEFLSTLDLTGQLCSKRSYTEVMYLAQHNLFMQFPVLWADISIPDYVYADLDCSNHTPPRNDEGLVINIWLGPRGTVSPAHTDPYHNMYVQVVGDKTVWLAPPNINEQHIQGKCVWAKN